MTFQVGQAVWLDLYRVSILGTVTARADEDGFYRVDIGGHDPFGRYGPSAYLHGLQMHPATMDDVNVWGTPRADVGQGYCPDCEHEEPRHYRTCDRFPSDTEAARRTLDLPLRPLEVAR